jgi:hypothetical protein
VEVNFEGTDISVSLKDEKGDNYYYAIVDDEAPITIRPDTVKKTFTIASNLHSGSHHAQLYKLTESRTGRTAFYSFTMNPGATLLPPNKPDKKIEFYGNSITVGYSVDDTIGDSNAPCYTNNYYSYAAITARHYKADYTCIAKSGIGLMLSWFPIIMPEMYDRLDEADSINKWNFSWHMPNVVVINLGQNDSWLVNKKGHPQFKARFGVYPPDDKYIIQAYKNFFKEIRLKYPSAAIICALGSMDATKPGSPWPGYIEKAVASLHDDNMHTCFFPYNNTNKHPKRKEQMAMADQLIQFIDKHVSW